MKQRFAGAFAAVVLALGTNLAATDPVVRGQYVEARTAEVFTGGCIMGSEGEVSGREAIMAWHVSTGALNGVRLDDLSVVAVVAGENNLGTHELGGVGPGDVKAIVMTDARATAAQRDALVAMARALAPDYVSDVIRVSSVDIDFRQTADGVAVNAGPARLDVATNVRHSPECGAIKWFDPLASTVDPIVGLTRSNEWAGSGLGAQWKQLDRKSSFVGSFSLAR